MLKEPVPQPNKHEGKEWYHPTTTREESELILQQMPNDGAFLVRQSDQKDQKEQYVISFRYFDWILKEFSGS
jgi:phosphatidylinositol phospholipase C gamma-1